MTTCITNTDYESALENVINAENDINDLLNVKRWDYFQSVNNGGLKIDKTIWQNWSYYDGTNFASNFTGDLILVAAENKDTLPSEDIEGHINKIKGFINDINLNANSDGDRCYPSNIITEISNIKQEILNKLSQIQSGKGEMGHSFWNKDFGLNRTTPDTGLSTTQRIGISWATGGLGDFPLRVVSIVDIFNQNKSIFLDYRLHSDFIYLKGLISNTLSQITALKNLLRGTNDDPTDQEEKKEEERCNKIISALELLAQNIPTISELQFLIEEQLKPIDERLKTIENKVNALENCDFSSLESQVEDIHRVTALQFNETITVPKIINAKIKGSQTINSIPEFLHWIVVGVIDPLIGNFPIHITAKDDDPTKKGNQEKLISIPNLSVALEQIIAMNLLEASNSATIKKTLFTILPEIAIIKQLGIKTEACSASMCEFLGYGTKEKRVKVPFTYDLTKKRIDEILKPSEQEVIVIENDTNDWGFQEWASFLLDASGLIMGTFGRGATEDDRDKLIDSLIPDYGDDRQRFDDFTELAERGFGDYAGIETLYPYGYPFNRRPKITEKGQDGDTRDDIQE